MKVFLDSELSGCLLSRKEFNDFKKNSERRLFYDPIYGDSIVVYVKSDGSLMVDSTRIVDKVQNEMEVQR